MLKVRVGSLRHWRIANNTRELHPFHIHQVHFLAYAVNGVPSRTPEWLDIVNVRKMSVFHCHLLSHEDKGMMAKILFQ